VNRQVIWEAQAIDRAAGFLRDDPDGVGEMLDAVARLAVEPSPAGSFPYGSPDRRRLRIGRYRVRYDITAETVSVWHHRPRLGRKLKMRASRRMKA
jgi:mRNA interferase RelE/StbE